MIRSHCEGISQCKEMKNAALKWVFVIPKLVKHHHYYERRAILWGEEIGSHKCEKNVRS